VICPTGNTGIGRLARQKPGHAAAD